MIWADYRSLLATPAMMREIDRAAARDYAIPGLILMENAAGAIADYIVSHAVELFGPSAAITTAAASTATATATAAVTLAATAAPAGGPANGPGAESWADAAAPPADAPERNALVICGRGNNGGDGFAVARKLHLRGFSVFILSLAGRDEIAGDAKTNLDICERLGINLIFAVEKTIGDILPFCLARADLIIDAIFGTGFRGRPEGVYEYAIRAVNDSRKKVVSVDIPSGLDGLSGAAAGACVRAYATLTLGLIKTGLVSGPDIDCAGWIELLDIGIPGELLSKAPWDTRLNDRRSVGALLKTRKRDAHKGDFGKIMIITGSPGMTGAGCLAAEAALTAGAGLVYLAVPGSLAHIYEASVREPITLCAGSNVERTICYENAEAIAGFAGRMDAVAIGPGMSNDPETARAIRRILSLLNKPVVIDADAITAVAADTSALERLNAPAVITPHGAEMARLLGVGAADVARGRLPTARAFAIKHKITLVLKGRHSIVATPNGQAYVNPTGNPGMATAGAGDVLTGIIAAFIGEGMDARDAAAAAVYLHGLAGDLAAAELGERSVRASDIIRYLPKALNSLTK